MTWARLGLVLSVLAIAVSAGVLAAWILLGGEDRLTPILAVSVAMTGLVPCAHHMRQSSGDKAP